MIIDSLKTGLRSFLAVCYILFLVACDGNSLKFIDEIHERKVSGDRYLSEEWQQVTGRNHVFVGYTTNKKEGGMIYAKIIHFPADCIKLKFIYSTTSGLTKNAHLDAEFFDALVKVKHKQMSALKAVFKSIKDNSDYSVTLPKSIKGADALVIVVPLVKIFGRNYNFSFSVGGSKADSV